MMDPRTSAQDVKRCDLCGIFVVQMYCDTCLVNLCKACVGEHIATDECEDHKVVKFQSRKAIPLYPGCTFHDKERCEMYCNPCHISICSTCLTSDQHMGHKLLKIMQALEEKKERITKEKTELNDTIYPAYQDIVSDVQNKMRQLEQIYGYLYTAITKHGEDWHREIDKLVQKLKAEVEEMKTTQLHTLQKYMDKANKNISDINREIYSIDVALHSNDMSKVFSFMPNVDEYKKLPQKILPFFPKFTPRRIPEELCKLFGTLSSISADQKILPSLPEFAPKRIQREVFGTLSPISVRSEEHGYHSSLSSPYRLKTTQKSPETASSPVTKQLLDEPQTVTTIHSGYGYDPFNVASPRYEEM